MIFFFFVFSKDFLPLVPGGKYPACPQSTQPRKLSLFKVSIAVAIIFEHLTCTFVLL